MTTATMGTMPPAELTLKKLTPQGVAELGVQRIRDRVTHLQWFVGLAPGAKAEAPTKTTLAGLLSRLTLWAQYGVADGWRGVNDADHALALVADVLWPPCGNPVSEKPEPIEAVDDTRLNEREDPLDLVMLAAWCRIQIARGHAVSLRTLAALAGISHRTATRAAADGELEVIGTTKYRTVSAAAASRFLASRWVPGYVPSA